MKKCSICVATVSVLSLTLSGFVTGCARQDAAEKTVAAPSAEAPSVDGSAVVLTAEPEGAQEVIAARKNAGDEEQIVLVGRIGGSENPWVDGRAAFSIVDLSLQACSDIPGDTCPHPWDYCCQTDKLPNATALVKLVNADGDVIKQDARELLNVKELATVVIRGKAQRDDAGNLTVLADGVFIKNTKD
ncbi:MAG: hypothetical protein WEB58_14730 [Planctomycetaceae bacterium]